MDTSPDPAAAPGPATGTAPATGDGPTARTGSAPPRPARDDGHADRTRAAGRRRRRLLHGLGTVATAAATGLVTELLSWKPEPATPPRALTEGEAERLAAVRVANYRDGRARLRATLGTGGQRTELVGWVDWTRPLIYLDVGGPGAGPVRGLVQATPRLVALRPDPAAVLTPAVPPLTAPTDGWRIRTLQDRMPLRALLDLLFGLSADRPDPTGPVLADGARWVARETSGRTPVDVFQLPGLLPADPTGRAPTTAHPAPDHGTRYWVDRDARLHRLAARLPDGTTVTLDLDRSHRPPLHPVDLLGGRPGLPRDLTWEESNRLAGMPARNRALGGVALALAVPTGTGANLRGGGWLDWIGQVAYLSTVDLDAPGRRTLARYDRTGVARAELPAGDEDPAARPPLPLPQEHPLRPGRRGSGELDLLIDAALRVGRTPGETGRATWLRRDSTGRRQVDVIEFRSTRTTLRHWVDRSGVLRRLELRTPAGAWAQLELVQAPVPMLPPAPTR